MAEIDAEYIARTEDVLALYEKPYNPHEPVVCLDEKPVVLRAEVRHPQPARPGSIAKRDGEYKRRGTANVFCVVEAKAGRPFTRPTTNRSGAVFAKTIEQLARRYPHARTSHLVFDNLNTHCRKSLEKYFGLQKAVALWSRFAIHRTPKHGSRLNQAEVEISLFSSQCLGTRRIQNLTSLRAQAKAWNQRTNRDRVITRWNFSRTDAQAVFHYQSNLFPQSR